MKFELFFELVYWCIDSVCLVNIKNFVVNNRPRLLTFKGPGAPILMHGSQEIYPALLLHLHVIGIQYSNSMKTVMGGIMS